MILTAGPPVYLTVEVEGVNVPLMTNGVVEPERVMVLSNGSNVPVLIVKTEPTVKFPAAVKVVPTWSKYRLL